MSKGQKRSNREIKKPKQQPKSEKKIANYMTPLTDERTPIRVQRERALRRR